MYKLRILIIITIVACTAGGFYIAHYELRDPQLEVYFFRLNRGRSIFLRTPRGKTILIDGGQSGDIIAELTKLFPFYRRRLDVVLVTNALPKNVGGLVEVVGRYDVGKIIEPAELGTSTALTAFEKVVDGKKVAVEKVGKGDRFEVDSVRLSVISIDSQLVLHLDYASTSMIFLGDVSKKIQRGLIDEVSRAHLIEFSHAGADSRINSDFFNKISPDLVIYSKKLTTRTPSKTKKKFDIDTIDTSRLVNIEEKGTTRLVF